MKAVIYARVSTKDQEREGFSIPAQLKLLAEYAQRGEFKVVREFTDVETAGSAGRIQFGEMVKFLRYSKDVKVLLVEKTDRLYRNFRDYVLLEDLGLEVHLVKEGEVINKDAKSHTKFVHGIKVLLAKNFLDNLSEEVKKGMGCKAEQGLWPSNAPFGYKNVDKRIVPDEEEAPMVRQIFHWYATGNYSLTTVHNLFKQAFPFKTIARSYIEWILKNPVYYGDFLWNGKLYKGLHVPLVSKNLWDAVQEVFGKANKPKYTKRNFPFIGMMTCARCGCAITASFKKGRYIYYHCTGSRGSCLVRRHWVRQEVLEEKFGEVIRSIVIPDSVMDWLVKALGESRRGETVHKEATLKRARTEYKSLEEKINLLLDDRLQGKIPEDLCYQKINQLRSRQASLREQIELYEKAEGGAVSGDALRIIELANKAYSLYLKQDAHKKATLLKIVQSNSTWDGVSLCPIYRKPFDVIAQSVKNEGWLALLDAFKHFSSIEAVACQDLSLFVEANPVGP